MTERNRLIRTDEAQVLLLDKMLQEIRALNKKTSETAQRVEEQRVLMKNQEPEGIVDPIDVTVTTENRVVTPPMGKFWFSISIVNDGPSEVSVVVNTEKSSTNPYRLRKGEPCEVEFGSPKIKDLLLRCEAGSASLRIRGVR